MMKSTVSKVMMRMGRVFPNKKYGSVNKALGATLGASSVAALVVVVALVWASPAWASTITVNSLADDADGTDGECTLREAITAANTNTASGAAAGECAAGSGSDVIDVGVTGTVQLTGALPGLASNIEIEGPGADQFTVRRDTGGDYRIFTVEQEDVVSISGITITNGNSLGGAGISNQGTLTISASTISDNSTVGVGAGISNNGDMTVTGSTISGNTASDGGGIFSDTELTGQKTTITNSTISGNTATQRGGGVFNHDGLSVIKYSTITNNTAPTDQGSGVLSFGDTFTRTEVLSSIISANTNTDVDSGTTTNSFDSEGYNLIGDGNATGAFNQTGDQSGVSDPKLGALADNGGPTNTHALQENSPALNAGPPSSAPECQPPLTDQRGVARPQQGSCDIGSYERDTTGPTVKRAVPTENSTIIVPARNIKAYFSEVMDATTIMEETFKFYKKGSRSALEAELSYNPARKRAVLNPVANLERGVTYKAEVSTAAQDLSGNSLDQDQDPSNGNQPKVWFFTVRN